jgi:hypothetical protein
MAVKKRTSRKKGFSTTEKILIASGIGVGGYFLWTKVISPLLTPPDITPTATVTTSGSATAPTLPTTGTTTPAPAPTVSFDPTKVLRKGAPASTELKYSKIAFNSEIEMARAKKNVSTFSTNTRERLAAIAALPLLDTNTKFGDETEKVAKVILGSKTFTYNGVKRQKTNMWIALGLGNPYN